MKIPRQLPQFENERVLLAISGEFDSRLFVASEGSIVEQAAIQLNPREEAKEKQGFIGKKGGMQSLGAVSHHERYMEDLKYKFARKVAAAIESAAPSDISRIFIFAPSHVVKRIVAELPPHIAVKITATFAGAYTKKTPIAILGLIQKEWDAERNTTHLHLSEEERKIIHRPKTRAGALEK